MNLSSFSLNGQVALVTGGSRGIGEAIALTFAEAGADIVLCSRHINDAEKVANAVRRLGRRSLAVEADVSLKADVENLVALAVHEFGAIDILVNNAGMLIVKSIMTTTEEDWDNIVNVNLKSCYLCSQTVGKLMMERKKGIIINLTTSGAFKLYYQIPAYCAVKAGIPMLTEALAKELGPYNIRVNAIAPGLTKTEMSRYVWGDPNTLELRIKASPLGRVGEAGDVAQVALFLSLDLSRFVTGRTIIVDGGLTI